MHTDEAKAPPIASPPRPTSLPPSYIRNGVDLRRVAICQRRVLWLVLASVCSIMLDFVAPQMARLIGDPDLALVLLLLPRFALQIAIIFGTIQLMRALRTGIVTIVVAAVLMVLPLLGLLFLLLENRRATRVLRSAGLRVGLMGVKDEDVVRALAPNLCRQCGYDLTGNESGKCPECGTVLIGPSSPLSGRSASRGGDERAG